MIFGRFGTFTGGIELPDDKRETLGEAIRPLPRIERLHVPIALSHDRAKACVNFGQMVRPGERIALGRSKAHPSFIAPMAGEVTAVTSVNVIGQDGFDKCVAVRLSDVGVPPELTVGEPQLDLAETSDAELADLIDGSALFTHRQAMLPVSNWIDRARRNRCRTLICNGMENQPRVTAEHRILAEFPQAVVEGLRILARLTAARETFLAVDRRRTGDYRGLVESARRHDIERVALTHKYPTGADAVLVKVLTRREVMFAGVPIGQHIAVTEPATCLAVYRQVVCGQAPVGRVVTVIGGGDLPAGNYYLPFGTVVSDIIPHGAIHGGPMSGLRCDESAVVTPGTDALLKLQADEQFAPGPCIRCGWCTGHCPARLNVAMMNDHFELGEVLQARRDGVFACVECGICTYVCPAGLPLSQRMRKLKWALRRTRRNTREQA